jgi:tripartite-type tricarboxylate transporter receptor subunit TctC
MGRMFGRIVCALVMAAAMVVGPARADTIKILVPFAAGGPVDTMARMVGAELQTRLGMEVIVENRGGAGGALATETVARAAPDGKTLLMASLGSHVINPSLRAAQGYDPAKSFAPIALIGEVPSLVVVSADSPVKTFAELIARAKKESLSYGSAGPGTTMHIAGELFNSSAGVKTTHVPYRGAGPAINDLLGGHIQFMNADLSVLLAQVTSGKMRALVLFSPQRTPLLPDLATSAELGYPAMVIENFYGLLAPAGTPADVVAKLEKATLDAVAVPSVADKLKAAGVHGAAGAKGFAAKLDRDFAYWGPEIKKLGITGE